MKKIVLNKEICEFVGALIGDGYWGCYGKNKSHYLVGLVGDRTLDKNYLVNYMMPLIKRNFPFTKPKVRYRTDENTIMLRMNSKELFNFIANLFGFHGKKSRVVKIPEAILENENLINWTIMGIFDTDGCIFLDQRKCYKKPYPRITLQSASIPLITQLESYFVKFFSIYVNKSNRDGYRNFIEIYGHKQLETFLKKMGFSNQRHLSKIK